MTNNTTTNSTTWMESYDAEFQLMEGVADNELMDEAEAEGSVNTTTNCTTWMSVNPFLVGMLSVAELSFIKEQEYQHHNHHHDWQEGLPAGGKVPAAWVCCWTSGMTRKYYGKK